MITKDALTRLLLTIEGGAFSLTNVFRFLKDESSLRRSL